MNNIPKESVEAIEFLIGELEGGFDKVTEDPHDVGGLTKGGIAQRYYPDLDIRNLTKEQIIEIAYNDYYSKYEKIPYLGIRHFLYWCGFNIGNGWTRKALQRHINDMIIIINSNPNTTPMNTIVVDGVLGNNTAKAMNNIMNYIKKYDSRNHERIFIYTLEEKIIERYQTRPTAWKHLWGWMNRVHKMEERAGLR